MCSLLKRRVRETSRFNDTHAEVTIILSINVFLKAEVLFLFAVCMQIVLLRDN